MGKAKRHGRKQVFQSPPARTGSEGIMTDGIATAARNPINVTAGRAVQWAAGLYSEKRFDQAERVCRQIIDARPANANAHNLLGVSLQALGRGTEAVEELRLAVNLAPMAPNLRGNLGEVLRQNGELDEAESELRKAIELDPRSAQALNNLGIIHYERRKYEEAVGFYRQAIEIRPDMSEALNNLGNSLRQLGDIDGALAAYQGALTYRETYPEAYNNLGTLLEQQKKADEAEHALRKAIQQKPHYLEAHNNLASLLSAQKRDVEALRIVGDALKISPGNSQTLLITARIQMRRGNQAAAEQAARLILKATPGDVEALTLLGQVLHETDHYDEALEVLGRAVAAEPNNPEALNFHGIALKSVGRLDEARDSIMKAMRLNDAMFGAFANLSDLVDFSTGEGVALFNRMDSIFKGAKNTETDLFIPLHFAFGKALEDRGDHERALEHFITGGRLKRAQLHYSEAETFAFFDDIRKAFPKDAFQGGKHGLLADERPIFIIGMPRSGSTLVEQIISSHRHVHGAGEVKHLSHALGQLRDRFPSLPKFPQMMDKITPAQLDIVGRKYLSALASGAGNARRITDKLLTNYFFVGLIHMLYPNAKFVHTARDPVDTCLSGFTKLFKDDMPHSYDLIELGRYYGKYRELMEHWQNVLPAGVLKTVRYEDVVADTETEARALIEFIGLDWDPRCLDFHKSERPVKTASVAQVRRPIYKSAVKRWKKYGAGLQPLVSAIDEIRQGQAAARG